MFQFLIGFPLSFSFFFSFSLFFLTHDSEHKETGGLAVLVQYRHWNCSLVNMFSLSRSKLTQSTQSLTSSEEFDDCYSQMGSPLAPSPSRYNYQERVLALFIQQQRTDCTSSSSSSSSTSPSPDDATPLGVCSRVPFHFIRTFYVQKKKSIFPGEPKHSRTRIYFSSEIEDDKGRILFFVCSFREPFILELGGPGVGGGRVVMGTTGQE